MAPQSVVRSSGAALIAGGFLLALFMLVHPYGEIAGAHAAHSLRWVPAHSLHFAGALLTVLGLPALYARQMRQTGVLGLVATAVAMAGTAMYVGTGMITAFIWPVIAQTAPGFVAPDGQMFTDPLPRFATDAPYVVMVVGYALLAFVCIRARTLPTPTAIVLVIGILLFSSPVEPVGPLPFILRVLGGVIFGGNLMVIGYLLWLRPFVDVATEPGGAAPSRAG